MKSRVELGIRSGQDSNSRCCRCWAAAAFLALIANLQSPAFAQLIVPGAARPISAVCDDYRWAYPNTTITDMGDAYHTTVSQYHDLYYSGYDERSYTAVVFARVFHVNVNDPANPGQVCWTAKVDFLRHDPPQLQYNVPDTCYKNGACRLLLAGPPPALPGAAPGRPANLQVSSNECVQSDPALLSSLVLAIPALADPASCSDSCPDDPSKSEPGLCGCGISDDDTDDDSVPDCNDECVFDSNKAEPGSCGCNMLDTDKDGDGTPDCRDSCPDNPGLTEPGAAGCEDYVDSDFDGTPDITDACPTDRTKIEAGQCGCGISDIDVDADTTADCNDLCPHDPSKSEPGVNGCGHSEGEELSEISSVQG